MNLTGDVVALQTKLAAAQRDAARAEGVRDAAKAAAEAARAELLRDFEVDTVADAEKLLETYRQELAATVNKINAALDRTGV